jgi:diadenosine tetraphosphate (Ap4A) HIT family hydrolase
MSSLVVTLGFGNSGLLLSVYFGLLLFLWNIPSSQRQQQQQRPFTQNQHMEPPTTSTCPFCTIASAHPLQPPTTTTPPFNPSATNPPSFPILSTPTVLAFLDIMPLAHGHLLVAPRRHAEKMSDLSVEEAGSLGAWLPVLSRVVCRAVGCADWNVVQNNGL